MLHADAKASGLTFTIRGILHASLIEKVPALLTAEYNRRPAEGVSSSSVMRASVGIETTYMLFESCANRQFPQNGSSLGLSCGQLLRSSSYSPT
jgi:hypothetical protein